MEEEGIPRHTTPQQAEAAMRMFSLLFQQMYMAVEDEKEREAQASQFSEMMVDISGSMAIEFQYAASAVVEADPEFKSAFGRRMAVMSKGWMQFIDEAHNDNLPGCQDRVQHLFGLMLAEFVMFYSCVRSAMEGKIPEPLR